MFVTFLPRFMFPDLAVNFRLCTCSRLSSPAPPSVTSEPPIEDEPPDEPAGPPPVPDHTNYDDELYSGDDDENRSLLTNKSTNKSGWAMTFLFLKKNLPCFLFIKPPPLH